VNVWVQTTAGDVFAIDLETEELEPAENVTLERPTERAELPRVVTAARSGSTVVALVDAKPPLMISHDAGATWRESGRGLPAGRSVAIAPDDPDAIAYASRNRIHVSTDGGRFWRTLGPELPEIEAIAF
jgi:hypothetical protein